MATPADRGWGTPGRTHGDAASVEYGRLHITKITTDDGSTFEVRKEVAPILLGFLNEIIAKGYRIKGKVLDDWGWYVRLIAGSSTLSNHSWGLAVDVNALTNPQGKVLRTDMPAFVPETAKRWGLRWGGTFANRPDAMHFEWIGSRDDALRFVQDLKALHAAATSPPEDVLMREENIIVVPPAAEGRQLVGHFKDGTPLGKWTATSSAQVCASNAGDITPLMVQPTRLGDALVLAVAKLDGSPAPVGAEARVLIEHR